jgi:hypothetical protein
MALLAENATEAEMHLLVAEAAVERAREREQRALGLEAQAEAEQVRGPAANLARARAGMHEAWAAVHDAQAQALEARARGQDREAATHKQEARDRELIALADQQRVDAAEHRARAAALEEEDVVLSQAEREERIRDRSGHALSEKRRGLHRFQPGVGSAFYSPGMVGTASTASRLAAMAREYLDREVELIGRALEQHGELERNELKELVGARYWGPGRFRESLRAAISEGRVVRRSPDVFAPPPEPGRMPPPAGGHRADTGPGRPAGRQQPRRARR